MDAQGSSRDDPTHFICRPCRRDKFVYGIKHAQLLNIVSLFLSLFHCLHGQVHGRVRHCHDAVIMKRVENSTFEDLQVIGDGDHLMSFPGTIHLITIERTNFAPM